MQPEWVQTRKDNSHPVALRRIMEEARKNDLSGALTFIDFQKAFDSINRQKMT